MSSAQVDEFLGSVPEPARTTLCGLRALLVELMPEGVEGISYGMPVIKVRGKAIAGYAAFARHCSYFPHSGSTLSELRDELSGYEQTKSSLHFPLDRTLPREIVARLVETRRAEAGV